MVLPLSVHCRRPETAEVTTNEESRGKYHIELTTEENNKRYFNTFKRLI
jgi:hypothetical protein